MIAGSYVLPSHCGLRFGARPAGKGAWQSKRPESQDVRQQRKELEAYLEAAKQFPLLTTEDEQSMAQTLFPIIEAKEKRDEAEQAAIDFKKKHAKALKKGETQASQRYQALVMEAEAVNTSRESLIKTHQPTINRFWQSNLRLSMKVAGWYVGKGIDLHDLVQMANDGLREGILRFDYRRGFKFSTFGVWWIAQPIRRALQQINGTHYKVFKKQYEDKKGELMVQLQRPPNATELQQALGWPDKKFMAVERAVRQGRSMSLDVTSLNDKGEQTSIGGLVSDPNAPESDAAQNLLDVQTQMTIGLSKLHVKYRTILALRYGLHVSPLPTINQITQLTERLETALQSLSAINPKAAEFIATQGENTRINHEDFRALINEFASKAKKRRDKADSQLLKNAVDVICNPDRYGQSMTLEQVGDVFGVTRERIRQEESKAKKRLEAVLSGKGLEE